MSAEYQVMELIEENYILAGKLKTARKALRKIKKEMFGEDFVENYIVRYEKWEKLVDDTLLKIGG